MTALPIIPLAHFTVKNKRFNGGEIVLKPFTVGQESILLMVKDSKDNKEVLNAIKQVAQECTVNPEQHDFANMPFYLIELLFLKLREHSNGELVDLSYRCKEEVSTEEGGTKVCDGLMEVKIDLREIDIVENPDYQEVFILHEAGDDSIGIEFSQPSIALIEKTKKDGDLIESLCLLTKKIFKGQEVWEASEMKKEDLRNFVKGIPSSKKREILEKFFSSPPRIKHETSVICPKCNKKHDLVLEGIEDFFT